MRLKQNVKIILSGHITVQQKWRNGVSVLAKVSICKLATVLQVIVIQFNQELTMGCVFGSFV